MEVQGYNVVDLLWCIDCKQCHGLECPLQGRPILISDSPTVPHAVASLPTCLHLQTIVGKRQVVAKETVSRRTMFGPVEAVEASSNVSYQEENGFVLKVLQMDGSTINLDTSDERRCNWMTLVTPATAAANQNLMVHQYQGSLYFTSTRDILAGEELRVWYAPHFAAQLGQLLLNDDDMCVSEPDLSVPSVGSPDQPSSSSHTESYDSTDCDSLGSYGGAPSESSSLDYLPVGSTSQAPVHSYRTRSSENQSEALAIESSCRSTEKIQTSKPSETPAKKASLQEKNCSVLKRRERKAAASSGRDSVLERSARRKSACPFRRGSDVPEDSSESETRKPSDCVFEKVASSMDATQILKGSPNKKHLTDLQQNCGDEEPLRTSEQNIEPSRISASKGNQSLTDEEFDRISERVREESLRSCLECCMILDNVESLRKHITSDHEKEPIPCPNCEKILVTSEQLKDHIENIHEESSRSNGATARPVCPLCLKRLGTARTYRKHLKVLHSSVFTCTTCHGKFWNHAKYLLHMRNHGLQGLQNDTTEMFKCEECGREFSSLAGLRVHRTSIHADKKFSCQYCKYSTSIQVTLKEHILSNHPENNLNIPDVEKFPCDGCSAVFLRVGPLNHHRRTHGQPRFKCQKCLVVYRRRDNLLKHSCLTSRQCRATVHGSEAEAEESSSSSCKTFQCPKCPKRFASRSNMNLHALTHQKQRFACSLCNREFHKRSIFDCHKFLHLRVATNKDGIKELLQVRSTTDDLHECHLCECKFTQMNALIQHLQKHHRAAAECIHTCIPCQRVFPGQEELEEHSSEHILIPIPPNLSLDSLNSCGVCGRVFKNASSLAAHEIVHARDKSHMCECCGKTFRRVAALKLHLSRLHGSDEKKYKCKICNKSFKSDCLRAHIQSHNDQRDYQCPHCERSFIQRGNYNRHVLNHSQKKVHQCKICNKTFKNLENLQRHQQNPKGHKFSCALCRSRFSSQSLLTSHIKDIHHMQETSYCKYCGRKFKYLQSYLHHMKQTHFSVLP